MQERTNAYILIRKPEGNGTLGPNSERGFTWEREAGYEPASIKWRWEFRYKQGKVLNLNFIIFPYMCLD